MKIIVDTNLWISFLIGKHLSVLKSLLTNADCTIFVCPQLMEEFKEVVAKEKIRRYVSEEDIKNTILLIERFCKYTAIRKKAVSPVRDVKDLYLLSLADTVHADFIITGDKDLLTLQCHNTTKIVTYNDFVKIK